MRDAAMVAAAFCAAISLGMFLSSLYRYHFEDDEEED